MRKIATTVYTTQTFELADGTEVTLRPLPLKPLRRVMDTWNAALKAEGDEERETLDVLAEMGYLCLSGLKDTKDKFDSQEDFEEVVDQETLLRIIKVCAGIDLEVDPKEIAAATMETKEEVGTK